MGSLRSTLLQINHSSMGLGDNDLGLTLFANYLKLMCEESETPQFIVLYNSGVRLVCKGSPVIEKLRELEQKGSKIVACTTCLKHFNLIDEQQAGIAGTMMDIIDLQKQADKVITL